MLTVQRGFGDFALSAYRYDGSRTLNAVDRFSRTGFGVTWQRARTQIDAVYQSGNDSAADADGGPLRTSGGFVQVRHELGPRTFAVARWDATQDTEFTRSLIGGFGYRFSRNTRLTLFDTAKRDDGRIRHTFSTSFLFAL